MSRFWKKSVQPYKLLVYLLYGEGDWILRECTSEALISTCRTGPMTRALGITTDRMKEYMAILSDSGLVQEVSYSYGKMVAKLEYPGNWEADGWTGEVVNPSWFKPKEATNDRP
jgi:hypothetical protein